MNVYYYAGPVYSRDGRKLTPHWEASTTAPTKEKAYSNLKYRFRIAFFYNGNAPLLMPGTMRTQKQ